MAIELSGKEREDGNGVKKQDVTVSNGDLEALNRIVEQWGFKDQTSALRFALAILVESNKNSLKINGSSVSPTEGLLKNGN